MSDSVVEKKWIIYKITRFDGLSYIGQTRTSLEKRWAQHIQSALRGSGGCRYIANSIKKYGKESFSIEVVGTANTQTTADWLETECIELYNTLYPNGMNLRKGCINFKQESEFVSSQTRELLRLRQNEIINRPGMKERISKSVSDYMASLPEEERIKKYGKGQIGKPAPNKGQILTKEEKQQRLDAKGARPILILEFGKVFSTQTDVAEFLDMSIACISRAINGEGRIKYYNYGKHEFHIRRLTEDESMDDVFIPTLPESEVQSILNTIKDIKSKRQFVYDNVTQEHLYEKYAELGTWVKVAEYYNVSIDFIRYLRMQFDKQQPQEN